jgi:hypothetical protein
MLLLIVKVEPVNMPKNVHYGVNECSSSLTSSVYLPRSVVHGEWKAVGMALTTINGISFAALLKTNNTFDGSALV